MLDKLLFFIILFLLFRRFSKMLEEQQKQRQEETKQDKLEDILQMLGLPIPGAETPEESQSARPGQTAIKRQPIESDLADVSLKPTPAKAEPEKKEKASPGELILSEQTLEEGIILSEILNPPKALLVMPGWRNWHSRWSQKPVTARS